MVDLEQFREAVECWHDAALPANDVEAERKAAAKHLLALIDNAKVAHEISAPTGRPARAWTEQEKADCKAALRRIVEMEEADNTGKGDQQPAPVVDDAMVERALNAKVGNWPVRQLFDSECEARIAMRAALSSVQGVERG